MATDFASWFKQNRIETCDDRLTQKLKELGATELSDLIDLEDEDLLCFQPPFLKKLEFVRFKRAIRSLKTSSAANSLNKIISNRGDPSIHELPPLPPSCPEEGCTGTLLSILGKRRNQYLVGLKGPDCRWFVSCTNCQTRWHACHFLCGHLAKISSIGSSDIIRHEKGRFNRWQKQVKNPCPKNPELARLKSSYKMALNQTLSNKTEEMACISKRNFETGQHSADLNQGGDKNDTSRLGISKGENVMKTGKGRSEGNFRFIITPSKSNQGAGTNDKTIINTALKEEKLTSKGINSGIETPQRNIANSDLSQQTKSCTKSICTASNDFRPVSEETSSSNETLRSSGACSVLSKEPTVLESRKISNEDNLISSNRPVQSDIAQSMLRQEGTENDLNSNRIKYSKYSNLSNERNSDSIQEVVEEDIEVDNNTAGNSSRDVAVESSSKKEIQPGDSIDNICPLIEKIILDEFESGSKMI